MIDYDWCDGAYYGEPDSGAYRWGKLETAYDESTTEEPTSPFSGSLKIKRNGNTVSFWNPIDDQWEPMPLPSGVTTGWVSFGVNVSWYTDNPMEVNFDNFEIKFN